MSSDLRPMLDEIGHAAQLQMRPVSPDALRTRLRRRRTARRTFGATASLAVAGGLVLAITTLGAAPAPAPADPVPGPSQTTAPSPSATPASTTPLPGWTPGAAPCGEQPDLTQVDSPDLEIYGGVEVGDFDRTTALFGPDPAGSTVFFDVASTSQVPGEPAGDGLSQLVLTLVDDTGTVVLWNDPTQQYPQIQSSVDSRVSSMYGMYDATDCRTGRPLVGTFRVIARDHDEVRWLGPVSLGPDATATTTARSPAEAATCNEPLSTRAVAAIGAPDLAVTLDPATSLDDVDGAGLHTGVTLTATGSGPAGDGSWSGLVPQRLDAFLVDDAGTVRTATMGPDVDEFDSGVSFDVTPGGSFPAQVFEWFTTCPRPNMSGAIDPGTYDLYVYDTVPATDASGAAVPLLAAGGPFRITLGKAW